MAAFKFGFFSIAKRASPDRTWESAEVIVAMMRFIWPAATFDPVTHTLYIAHGSGIASMNAATKAVTPHLADAQGAHIAVPFAGGGKLLVTHGKANQVTLNDAKTGAVDATIPTDAKPDAALIEPTTGRGFVMANGGGTVDVIDLDRKAVIARIAVGGAPEAATADGQGLVFTHLEDDSAIVVIDAKAMKVKATYRCATARIRRE